MTDPFAPAPPPDTEERQERRRSVGQLVFGTVLVGGGLLWLVAATDLFDVPWQAVLAIGLVVIGIAIAASAGRERHGGLVVVGIILTLLLALVSTSEGILDLPLSGGIGERTFNPDSITLVQSEYRLGIGEIVVDLSAVAFPAGETVIDASVTMGSLVVIVPDDVALRVESHVTAGEVTLLGDRASGTSINERFRDGEYDDAPVRLFLTADAGFGEVEVRR